MRTEGSIEQKGLPEVLLALGRKRRTGILTIQGRDEIIAFAFLKGGIVSADALNQTLEEGLGQVLSQSGLVGEDDFAGLAAEYQAGGGQVVDLLVERGFVERAELLDAVRTHTYQLCRQALGWTHGDYKFYQGEEVSYEEGVEPLSPQELLVRASRDLGLDLLPGGVPPPEAIYRRAKGSVEVDEAAAADELGEIDQQAFSAFKLIDGRRSVEELARESGVAEFRMAYLLNAWERGGMVERSKWSPPARKPAAAAAAEGAAPAPAPDRPAATRPPKKPRESRLASWWRAREEPSRRDSIPWPSRVLGLAFIVLFAGLFAAEPSRVLLPFPWQRGLQESLDRERASASLLRLRRANTAHFLLHGRFAEELTDLAAGRLVPAGDLEDENGQLLAYSATAASYVVRSSLGSEPEQESFLQETIRGNFLLDPELEPATESRQPLLVLLD